jgi:DNA polymerase III subunit delta
MSISPLTIVSGEETLLVNEAISSIEMLAQNQGFTEKQLFDQDSKETWEQFTIAAYSRSLFADKTRLICRFSTAKVSDLAQKAFLQFAEKLPSDKCLIIVMPKLTAQQVNAAWVQTLKKVGTLIQVWPIHAKQFPVWAKQRLQKAGYQVDSKSLQLLCDHTEGNLLAVQQCLEKLQLLYAPGVLTATDLMQCLAPSSRYTVFDLINAIWQKQAAKMHTILETLQAEGVEPAIVLWALARECRKHHLYHFLPALQAIDHHIKGISVGAVWPAMQRLCFAIIGRPLL